MSHRRRPVTPQLKGRARPEGPVFGLALPAAVMGSPLVPVTAAPTDDAPETKVVRRVEVAPRRIGARLVAVAAGGIELAQITEVFNVSARQRQTALYSGDGRVALAPDYSRMLDPQTWQDMQTDEILLLTMGYLFKQNRPTGQAAKYDFKPSAWDVANMNRHVAEAPKGLLPVVGLTLPQEHLLDLLYAPLVKQGDNPVELGVVAETNF